MAQAGTDSLSVTVKKDHFTNAVMVAQWGLHFTYFMSGGERAQGSVRFWLRCFCEIVCIFVCRGNLAC